MKWILRNTILGFMVTGLVGAASMASTQGPATDASVDDVKAKAVVQSKCTVCHDLERLGTAKLDKAGWKEIVNSMRTKGADLKDDETVMILDYLGRTYPVDNAEMKKLVEKDCASCHDLERTTSGQKTKDAWAAVVDEMISFGSAFKPAQAEAVTEYLARHYGVPKKKENP